MPNKSWTVKQNLVSLARGSHTIYTEVSRSCKYPFSSTRQDSKKYAEFDSCGRRTIGRVARDGSK